MPIDVIPRWIKILVLAMCLVIGWYLWDGDVNPKGREEGVFLAMPAPSLERGLPGKAGANISQFVSNPLEPTRLPEEGTVILRDTASSYYKDEP
jgi:hypothetical protein